MRYQSVPGRCGPAALREALRVLGTTHTEDQLATLAGTTTDGTRVGGLTRAAKAVNPSLDPRAFNDKRDVGLLRLLFALRVGVPVLPCVDDWDHWVACVGLVGVDTVILADPADEEMFLYLSPGALAERWARSKDDKCFALYLF